MKFSLTVIAAIIGLAVALPEPVVDLPILAQRDLGEEGLLTFYEREAPEIESRSLFELDRRCGTNSVKCYNTHQAETKVCGTLINRICGNTDKVPGNPRSVCLKQSGSQCCISWNSNSGSFPRSYLCDAAKAVYDKCKGTLTVAFVSNMPASRENPCYPD
jgi:hypothetical protein